MAEKKTITTETAQGQFDAWLERIGKETADLSLQQQEEAEKIIRRIEKGQITFTDDGKITYHLKFPVDTTEKLEFKSRIKVSQSARFSGKEDDLFKSCKVIESYTGVPATIIKELDMTDFLRVAGIIGFFG